jgi:predicted dinucleotide-binding enzyme
MTIDGVRTIGLIGAGHIGSQVARAAIANGYDVVISNSRGPETLTALVSELGPQARAGTTEEAAAAGDLAVVAIPLKAIGDVPVEPLAGKVVIDTNNYYPGRDGQIAASTMAARPAQSCCRNGCMVACGQGVQSHLRSADHHRRYTAAYWNRRALIIAGDDLVAKAQVAELLDGFGFDVVDVGPLAESWRIQPGTPGYVTPLNSEEMTAALAAAQRS